MPRRIERTTLRDGPAVQFRFPVRKRTGFDRFFAEQTAEMTPDMVALCRRVYSAQEMFCRKYAAMGVATGTIRIDRDNLAKLRELS